MKKIFLLLLLLPFVLGGKAQEDSLQTNRYVMRATLYGAGYTNILDTYLSPMEYTGPEIRILRESMRMTKLLNGNVSAQSLFQINLSLTDNKAETGSELAGLINWNYAWHYQFRLAENLKILAGPMIDLNGGFVYNTRNSNNPAQAKAYVNIAGSGMVIYRFRIGNYPLIARYQANLPLMGVMFSPEYGQSYYEIFSLKGNMNVRAGYICDIQQAKVNHLKSHTWSHVFMLGFVKNFYLIKNKKKVGMSPKVSPY